MHFAGGGHNDVWMMAFLLGALALAARLPRLAGVSFALAGGLKWVVLGILPLKLMSAGRRQALLMTFGFIVTAAADHIPPPLLKQLRPGGRMVIPIGPIHATQRLVMVEKDSDGKVKTRSVLPVRFVPLTGGADGTAK